ncbi:MAG TPA: hypothetical protein VKQ30_15935 [Ktedonobacterales bacterium]|nr:hypothetical protein [Ktedonobacterales bacterium]
MDTAYAEELLRRQASLQAEAERVLAALDLVAMLASAGTVAFNGSYVTGLMVWRDLDLSVMAPGLTSRSAYETMLPLLTHPDVTLVRYRNEAGGHNATGRLEDDRYFFANYYLEAGQEWKIDISFWVSRQPHAELLPPELITQRLTDETRLAILWLKDIWHRLPVYMTQIGSVDIYNAVLDYGVRTPEAFEAYLREHNQLSM